MAKTKENQKYYSVTQDFGEGPITSSHRSESPIDHTLATIKVSNGEDEVSYACTANLSIAISGDMASNLVDADAYLKISASNSTGFNTFNDSNSKIDLTNADGVSLKTIYDAAQGDSGTKTISDEVGFSLKKGVNESIEVKGNLYLVNTNTTQNSIANKNLNVKIEITGLSCDVVESA